jgi:HSP20 family protein
MMDLVRFNPVKEMMSLRDRMNRFFDEPFFSFDRRDHELAMGTWNPAVDMFEKDDKLVIKAELPGVDKKDVSLDLKDGILTLKGERKLENEVKDGSYYRCEMTYGKFMRSFALPADVDPESINAEFQKGLLTIEVPKPENRKPRQIAVN